MDLDDPVADTGSGPSSSTVAVATIGIKIKKKILPVTDCAAIAHSDASNSSHATEPPHDDNEGSNSYSKDLKQKTLEHEDLAKASLTDYLLKRGVDSDWSKIIKLHVKPSKSKTNGQQVFSVHYTDSANNLFSSKQEVMLRLSKMPSKEIDTRQENYSAAALALNAVTKRLPYEADQIKVFNFGSFKGSELCLNTDLNKIYPIGYRCEQVIDTADGDEEVILCEIVQTDQDIDFVITVHSTGSIYSSPSEVEAWKQVGQSVSHLSISLRQL